MYSCIQNHLAWSSKHKGGGAVGAAHRPPSTNMTLVNSPTQRASGQGCVIYSSHKSTLAHIPLSIPNQEQYQYSADAYHLAPPPTPNKDKIPVAVDKQRKNKRGPHTMRKAPYAPKRFKSSYICFFMAKQGEIKEALGDEATVALISKRSAEMWYVVGWWM